MIRLFIFGLGYAASHISRAVTQQGGQVVSTGSAGSLRFEDAASVRLALADATHILSSVPAMVDGDPVLMAYGDVLRQRRDAWIGYLSSTGVYGDTGGAWVDESAPIKGRRASRNAADQDWQDLGARVFRLPGIYGPGRSALDRVAEGRAHRINLPDQVFSRVHVDDITSGVIAGFDGPSGVYNLSDDLPCGQNAVIELACDLSGLPYPALQTMEEAGLSPMARAFYNESRRVANGKAKRVLGWTPLYPDYRSGLMACLSAGTRR
ncbi:MAG: SDR family NAD(P)-dependent oxidoreductase [Chakrabartia sp.]